MSTAQFGELTQSTLRRHSDLQLNRPAAVTFVDALAPAQPSHLIHLLDGHFGFARPGDSGFKKGLACSMKRVVKNQGVRAVRLELCKPKVKNSMASRFKHESQEATDERV